MMIKHGHQSIDNGVYNVKYVISITSEIEAISMNTYK